MREPLTVNERVQDVDLVEQMLARVATPDEASAARRVLGIQREADRLTLAHSPALPPPPPVGQHIDHLGVARAALARYETRLAECPEGERHKWERIVRKARQAVARLENREEDS